MGFPYTVVFTCMFFYASHILYSAVNSFWTSEIWSRGPNIFLWINQMFSALCSIFWVWYINLNDMKEKSCLQISVELFLWVFVDFGVYFGCVLLYQCPMDQASYSAEIVVLQQSAIWLTCTLADFLGSQFLPHPVLFDSHCLVNVGKTGQLISRHGCPISSSCSFPLGALHYW